MSVLGHIEDEERHAEKAGQPVLQKTLASRIFADPRLRPRYDLQRRMELREGTMEQTAARHAAETLFAEHKAGTQFKPLGPPNGPAAISDAYDIQDQFVSLLRPQQGDDVGYKVGLTSAAMQTFCGIDHPIAGVVLAKRVHRSETTVHLKDFGRLGLEFEIAVRIKSDVAAGGTLHTASTIQPHIDGVCAAIELVDDRSADYANLDVRSLVADNSWNAGIVLSDFVPAWPDLEAVLGKATRESAPIGEGHGRDILGHPFNSVAWLANQLASRGQGLKAGQVVMTGSVMKTVFPSESGSYRFAIDGLGAVGVRVVANSA
jgi:2-keto-4-pentenoate hydratase